MRVWWPVTPSVPAREFNLIACRNLTRHAGSSGEANPHPAKLASQAHCTAAPRALANWAMEADKHRVILKTHCYTDWALPVISIYTLHVHSEAQTPLGKFDVNILYNRVCNKSTTNWTDGAWALVYSLTGIYHHTCEQQRSIIDGTVDLT